MNSGEIIKFIWSWKINLHSKKGQERLQNLHVPLRILFSFIGYNIFLVFKLGNL